MQVCGVEIGEADLRWLRERSAADDDPSRSRVAREFCHRLGILDRNGRPREVSARIALGRLERRGAVQLPAPASAVPRSSVTKRPQLCEDLRVAPGASLEDLDDVEVLPVRRCQRHEHAEWNRLMATGHYLGAGPLCGSQLRYLVRCRQGLLGALAFSAGAWRLAARDRWIGWSEAARWRNLRFVVSNTRFLLASRIPNLASHVLALTLARLGVDWQDHYGYKPLLVETFVDPERFSGACYRAAGWIHIGTTSGRGRQDREHDSEKGPKDIYVFPLDPGAKDKLSREPIRAQRTDGDWADAEFATADLPDQRLNKRLCSIARDFLARPTANIPQACSSRSKTKALYRFCAHEAVSMEAILAPHYEATLSRTAQEKQKVVLAIQDTTSLKYCSHPATKDLGPIGSFGAQATLGLLVHSTLLVNSAGTSLGLLNVQCWARDPDTALKAADRQSLPIEQKESCKWLESYRATVRAQRRLEDTKLVNVGDREADIYELFEEACRSPENPGLLIRAVHPRRITNEAGAPYLWEHVRSLPCMGTLPLSVPRRGSRPARATTLELRFAEVELRSPRSGPRRAGIKLWAIGASEAAEPEQGGPIEWLLLTTVAVSDAQKAAERVAWYTLRWQIEVYHRTLKSGCRLENRQLGSADSLKACIAIDLVVGWRIFYLAKLGREVPDVPCSVFFEEAEWKALVCFVSQTRTPPSEPPSLREAIRMVASLGGFLGRKGDGEPGTQTLWLGLQRLDDIAIAFRIFVLSPSDTS